MYYINYLSGIWLVILGLLAVPSLIISRKPEAREWFDKVLPFQGWIGVASVVYGLLRVLGVLTHLWIFDNSFLYGITSLAAAVLQLALGLLLGVGVIKTFITSPSAREKLDAVLSRLAPKQGTLGVASVIVGLWIVVYLIAFLPSPSYYSGF